MNSPEEWWHAAEGKRLVAEHMKEQRDHAAQAIEACGMGCEFAFKALIMKRTRMNRWPDRDRPEYYVHDLRKLMNLAGLTRADVPKGVRSSLATAFTWNIEHRYADDRVPRKQAREMFDAIYGENGVVQWLKAL